MAIKTIRIQDWHLIIGQRDLNFKLLRYVTMIVLIVINAWSVTNILGAFYKFSLSEQVGVILAVAAIFFAAIQFTDARQHTDELNYIKNSLPTRFVDTFPDNLQDIIQIVEQAKHNIVILVDFVDYGSYSRPQMHKTYQDILINKMSSGVSIRILAYDRPLAEDEIQDQFPERNHRAFIELRNRESFKAYFQINSGSPENMREFYDVLLEHADTHRRRLELNKKFDCRYLSKKPPFFLWMSDGNEAVFAFKDRYSDTKGLSFRTRDPHLVRQFSDIFEHRWDKESHEHDSRGTLVNRLIGVFPKHLVAITDLIKKGQNITILTDIIGYGATAATDLFERYIDSIKAAMKRTSIRLMCYGSSVLKVEFSSEDPKKLQNIMKMQENYADDLSKQPKVEIKYLKNRSGMLIWTADCDNQAEAVVVFQNIRNNERGLAFHTVDPDLVKMIRDIVNERWLNAETREGLGECH